MRNAKLSPLALKDPSSPRPGSIPPGRKPTCSANRPVAVVLPHSDIDEGHQRAPLLHALGEALGDLLLPGRQERLLPLEAPHFAQQFGEPQPLRLKERKLLPIRTSAVFRNKCLAPASGNSLSLQPSRPPSTLTRSRVFSPDERKRAHDGWPCALRTALRIDRTFPPRPTAIFLAVRMTIAAIHPGAEPAVVPGLPLGVETADEELITVIVVGRLGATPEEQRNGGDRFRVNG
jgi:hypothetical protein